MLRMSQDFHHVPVLHDEVVELLAPVPTGIVLDATVGGGGHASALLSARSDLRVIGLDRDRDAVEAAKRRLAAFGDRAVIVHARFDEARAVLERETGVADEPVLSGALFDLGVSSHQLDAAERGFSYREDGPLDMRMDRRDQRSAADLVNGAEELDLAELFAQHGEDRFGRRIARAVVAARPISTTSELAAVVAGAVPAAARRRGHPARRVFQALRVAVNDELALLGPALEDVIELLVPGGRLVVLAYHSGEDRIVKSTFLEAATGGCVCPPGLPCGCGAVSTVRLLNRGARKAREDEIGRNPRAESVRLRALERL